MQLFYILEKKVCFKGKKIGGNLKNNSILIISNNNEIGNKISDKIKLLREYDTIKTVSYIESISVLNSTQPSLIIVYSGNTDSVTLIKEIRAIQALDKVPIIFAMDSFVEDILFYAFDIGIDDFFFMSDPDSLVLMRIFLTLQKSVLYKNIDMNQQILTSANILDYQTGVFNKEYAQLVFRHFVSKNIEENVENTIFAYVKPVSLNKKRLDIKTIAKKIKSVLRGNDVVAYGKGVGFYLILYSAGLKGAQVVANKIRNVLAQDCNIFANATEITTSFEEMESILVQSMKNQVKNGELFSFISDVNDLIAVSSFEVKDENGKQFHEFQKEFSVALEKIVAPVFYQMQTSYSEKMPSAEIKFNISDTESTFSIKQDTFTSELVITYPTYIKLIMDIKHYAKDEKPIVRRLSFDFEDLSEDELTAIISNMLNDFAQRVNLDLMKQSE